VAASVSPALVIQHYGSKDGLRAAVDEHVVTLLGSVIATVTGEESGDARAAGSVAAAVSGSFPQGSPVPAYLARLLIDGGPSAQELFREMLRSAREGLDAMVAAGRAAPGADPNVRAAFLLLNDLAAIAFHELVRDIVGVDPLADDGMARWGREVLAIYGGGLTHMDGAAS